MLKQSLAAGVVSIDSISRSCAPNVFHRSAVILPSGAPVSISGRIATLPAVSVSAPTCGLTARIAACAVFGLAR